MIESNHLTLLQDRLCRGGPEAVLIAGDAGKRWIFGVSPPRGCVVITGDGMTLFSAGELEPRPEVETLPERDLRQWLRVGKISLLGVDEASLSYRDFANLEGELRTRLYPYSHVLERLRAAKEPQDLEKLARAQQICTDAFSACLSFVRPGMTQAQISGFLVQELMERSGEELPFLPLVCVGPASAHPHGLPGNRILRSGDLVVLDFGCRVEGWCADMTRTLKLGPATECERKMYREVFKAQKKATELMVPGASGERIDRAVRELLREREAPSDYPHALAHGIGLELHEAPTVASFSRDILEEGMVLAVEPGVYIPGAFGIRLEDMVCVEQGGARMLSQAPGELPEIMEV